MPDRSAVRSASLQGMIVAEWQGRRRSKECLLLSGEVSVATRNVWTSGRCYPQIS